jgi:hypothetical protein
MLSLEEQERRAYISGDVRLAAALRAVVDLDDHCQPDETDAEEIFTPLRYELAAPAQVLDSVNDLL